MPFRAFAPTATPSGVQRKQGIIRRLIEGRVSLSEAASQFRRIHRDSSAELERSLGCTPVPSDLEGVCRTLIGWVALDLSDRPDLAEDVSDRLESELQTVLTRTDKRTGVSN